MVSALLGLLFAASSLSAGDSPPAAAHFLGDASCSSSSCHGGAGEKRNQCLTWSHLDFHFTRPYATLTTGRSARLAETLKIADPAADVRCTVCHAPFQTVAPARLAAEIDFKRGISCENCHGPTENWLRSHTRPDYSHADRVRSGMRDLHDLYVRANTCVACHQNVDADLLRAGHPELIFELDGQTVTQPKHWHEPADWTGPKAWAVGQAAALREMSWQLSRESSPGESMKERWAALLWLLQSADLSGAPAGASAASFEFNSSNAAAVQRWADQLAQGASSSTWTPADARRCLLKLAGRAADFRAPQPGRPAQARRAERLVLALDRLVLGLDGKDTAARLNPFLDPLFKDAQSLPDFNPAQFAAHLEEFQKAVGQ